MGRGFPRLPNELNSSITYGTYFYFRLGRKWQESTVSVVFSRGDRMSGDWCPILSILTG
jgi:hypothetical protein